MRSGAENQLRFRAPPMLDLSLLVAALPEGYAAPETAPGEYWSRATSTRRCWRP